MCRWLAYIGEPRLIESLLYDGPRSLCEQAQHSHKAKLGVHGDGGGLGWYGMPVQPGIYRDAGPAWADPNLRELTRVLESRIFFAHVRASTGAPNIAINCHPFRSGKFLFMHNGQIGGFPQLRRRLLGMLSDDCFNAMVGGTDSELLFQLMITNGLKEEPVKAIRQTIVAVDSLHRSARIKDAFRATVAISDGQRIWALRWSSDEHVPSLFLNHGPTGALAVSEPIDEDISSWKVVPQNSLLCLTLGDKGVTADSHVAFIPPDSDVL
jgi:glutamine amidotransferase